MPHPIVPQIIELANPIAQSLGLEVVGAVFQTNQAPPVLRVDVRNLQQETGLEDCERMSKLLEATLDTQAIIPDSYVLEISSPGIPQSLTTDREFISFRGFTVTVTTSEVFQGHKEWQGKLVNRDEMAIHLNQKGRVVKIPRSIVGQVLLTTA